MADSILGCDWLIVTTCGVWVSCKESVKEITAAGDTTEHSEVTGDSTKDCRAITPLSSHCCIKVSCGGFAKFSLFCLS